MYQSGSRTAKGMTTWRPRNKCLAVQIIGLSKYALFAQINTTLMYCIVNEGTNMDARELESGEFKCDICGEYDTPDEFAYLCPADENDKCSMIDILAGNWKQICRKCEEKRINGVD